MTWILFSSVLTDIHVQHIVETDFLVCNSLMKLSFWWFALPLLLSYLGIYWIKLILWTVDELMFKVFLFLFCLACFRYYSFVNFPKLSTHKDFILILVILTNGFYQRLKCVFLVLKENFSFVGIILYVSSIAVNISTGRNW